MQDASSPSLSTSSVQAGRTMRAIGEDLGSRYVVEELLGAGAFATVWKVYDRIADETFAVKRFELSAASKDRNFYRELRALFRLEHPRIVRPINLIDGPSRNRYLLLEYCPGGSLRAALDRAEASDVPACEPIRALQIVLQIAEGIAAAHRLGLIHRDLKPENILFERAEAGPFGGRANVKIVDFGLARVLRDDDREGAAPLQGAAGSPAYMAPEQFIGDFSTRSDVYSIGVLLFELLHGALPFNGTVQELAVKHLNEAPQIDPGLGAPLRATLESLLAKDPTQRFGSTDEVVAELRNLIAVLILTNRLLPAGAQRPASLMLGRSFAQRLDMTPLSVVRRNVGVDQIEMVVAARNGLYRFRPSSGLLVGVVPIPGLTLAKKFDGEQPSLWLFREDGKVQELLGGAEAPQPVAEKFRSVDAFSSRAVGRKEQLAVLIGDEWTEFADRKLEAPIWKRSFRRSGTPGCAARLPNGRLVIAEGPDDPQLRPLDEMGVPIAGWSLPGPCWQLGLWPGSNEWLYARLLVDGRFSGFRIDANGKCFSLADSARVAVLAAQDASEGKVVGVCKDGSLLAWNVDGVVESKGRLGPSEALFTSLAASRNYAAAIGRLKGEYWLYGIRIPS